MTAEQFAYWLQGYAELNEAPPSAEQWQAIRDHLALVFNKVTPTRFTEPQQPYRWPAIDLERQWPGGPLKVTCSGAIAVHDETARLVC